MMGARGASVEDQDTVETSSLRDALTDAHEEWSIAWFFSPPLSYG